MRAFTKLIRLRLLAVFSLFLFFVGTSELLIVSECSAETDMAVVQDVSVTGEGLATRVEIVADKPLTYTYYSLKSPNRTVIDLSQAEFSNLAVPTPPVGSLIKAIDFVKNELSVGSLVRISLELDTEADLVVIPDPLNPNKIIITVATNTQPVAEQLPSTIEPRVAPVIATVPTEKTKTAGNIVDNISVEGSSLIIKTSVLEKYKYFTMSKPERLIVDIYNAKPSFSSNVIPINSLGITTARVGIYSDKVRLVFDTNAVSFPKFEISKITEGLKIDFVALVQQASTPVKTAQPTADQNSKPITHPVKTSAFINSIDFSIVDGYSRIQVSVTGDCELLRPVKTIKGVVINFPDCALPQNLQRPFETNAFDSPVLRITPYQILSKGSISTKLLVSLREETEFNINRVGSVFTFDFKNPQSIKTLVNPETTALNNTFQQNQKVVQPLLLEKRPEKKIYSGKRVTLEFADADIRKIFQLIAEVSNLNILVGDDVTGTITIKLVNVPWDQALDVILETKGLGMKQDGNIAVIRPKDKIVSLADEAIAAKKAYERTLEIRTKIFDINYASVSDMAGQFNSYKSERGTITVDNRTNRVIVNDIASAIDRMESLLRELDMPEKQVLIEARIVEASSNFTQDLGVQWGIHYRDDSGLMKSLDTNFGGIVTNVPTVSGLPAPSAYGGALGMTFGKLADNLQIDLRLSAAAETGQVKIISTPKVVTLNNKAAKISQGQMVPYATLSAEGTKTEFIEAALTLEVTPHITADGSVSMKIKASNNSVGSAAPGDVPPINKKEATTELLVKSGETTVIGGIYVDTETENDKGLPVIKDIPLLGWLFKSNSKLKAKSELLIFITPRIVN
jgi:type IV pilus assembly protein PilQ